MSESTHTRNRPAGGRGRRRLSRRTFMSLAASATALAGSSLLEACSPAAPAKPTTAPAASGSVTVLEALKKRKSAGAFQTQPLPKDKLLELLWAAWGQNVYLYCAAEGLGARFYAGVDRAALKDSLKLRPDQAIVFAQAVGYPKE